MTIIGTGCFSDCFTIRDLRLLELNLQFFVIFQTPLQGTEMKLTLSMHNSLFQFLRLLHFPSRIFLTHTVQYNHHLLYISLIYRLDGTRVFSIRIFNEVKPVFTVFAVQGISSLYIFQFHSTTNISGYQYLREAILITAADPSVLNKAVTKILYPEIARRYGTTALRVERCIRSAIETAWDRASPETLPKYFGCTVSSQRGKPSNAEFIALLAERLTLEDDQALRA